jgi:hypothetical protein
MDRGIDHHLAFLRRGGQGKMPQEYQPTHSGERKTSLDPLPEIGSAGLLHRRLSSEMATQVQGNLADNSSESAAEQKPRLDEPRQTTTLNKLNHLRQDTSRYKQPRHRLFSIGRLPRIIFTGIIICIIWVVATHFGQPAELSSGRQAPPGTANQIPTLPAGTASPATETPGPAQTSPDQVIAQFLSAYFSWKTTEDNAAYMHRWVSAVAETSLATVENTAPRLALDNGNDVAAQSPIPSISADAISIQQQNAQVTAIWIIQVVPSGGNAGAWQPRHIDATVLLIWASKWQVTNVYWAVGSI